MNTTVLNPSVRATPASFADPLAAIGRAVRQAAEALRHWATVPRDAQPPTAQHLLEMADAYQSTQPSFAADLRAAALRASESPARG